MFFIIVSLIILTLIIVIFSVYKIITNAKYKKLENEVLKELKLSNWNIASYFDEYVTVKSRRALENYNDIKFFKENREKLVQAENIIKRKNEVLKTVWYDLFQAQLKGKDDHMKWLPTAPSRKSENLNRQKKHVPPHPHSGKRFWLILHRQVESFSTNKKYRQFCLSADSAAVLPRSTVRKADGRHHGFVMR